MRVEVARDCLRSKALLTVLATEDPDVARAGLVLLFDSARNFKAEVKAIGTRERETLGLGFDFDHGVGHVPSVSRRSIALVLYSAAHAVSALWDGHACLVLGTSVPRAWRAG